ncbi:hypothetical protein C0995_016620 [Termitomyces sp. Mi166|nr:hypothetical protein C0995_016620 [Termitomyces sp. Mi166\
MDIQSFGSSLKSSLKQMASSIRQKESSSEHSILSAIFTSQDSPTPAITTPTTAAPTALDTAHSNPTASSTRTGSLSQTTHVPPVSASSSVSHSSSTLETTLSQSSSISHTETTSIIFPNSPSPTSLLSIETSTTQDPHPTQSTVSPQAELGMKSLGYIIGGVIGGLLVCVIAVVVIKRRIHRQARAAQIPTPNPLLSDNSRGRELEKLPSVKARLVESVNDIHVDGQTTLIQSSRKMETDIQRQMEMMSRRIMALEMYRYELEDLNALPEYARREQR